MSLDLGEKKKDYDELALKNFRDYLRIPSVHPDINYDDCVKFLKTQAATLKLPCKVVEAAPKKPVVIITWPGTQPTLPSILLNSHMDVVPVFEDKWIHKPFEAVIDETGKIFARGTQDMKSIGIQYLESIRRMKENGIRLKRTVHCSFVPDEEIGGVLGMREFIKTDDFKNLNIGFGLDEGIPSEDEKFFLFYGEKSMWTIQFHCPGEPGHGSQLPENSSAEKVRILLDRIDDYRKTQIAILKNDKTKTLADIMSINVTIINGGVQANVLPDVISITVNCRVPITTNLDEWEGTLKQWCKDAGDDVWMEKLYYDDIITPTKMDASNPYWLAIEKVIGPQLKPSIFLAATDSRYLRRLGIPALGISFINNTPNLLHADNEYLEKDVFLKGINIYSKLLNEIANV